MPFITILVVMQYSAVGYSMMASLGAVIALPAVSADQEQALEHLASNNSRVHSRMRLAAQYMWMAAIISEQFGDRPKYVTIGMTTTHATRLRTRATH